MRVKITNLSYFCGISLIQVGKATLGGKMPNLYRRSKDMEYKKWKAPIGFWILISLSALLHLGFVLLFAFESEPIAIVFLIGLIILAYSAFSSYHRGLIRYEITEVSFTVYDKCLEGGKFDISRSDFEYAYERSMGRQGTALILSKNRLDGKAIRRCVKKTFLFSDRKIRFEDVFVIYLGNPPKQAIDMIEKFASPIDRATQWYYD